MNIDYIQDKINDQREKLLKHELYSNIETIKDLQVFTENHVYAVWDFMSLLKALQIKLTCTKTPWVPNSNSQTAYLINEIVLAEETDINQAGKRKSHYELYLDAMIDIGAEIEFPTKTIDKIASSENIFMSIDKLQIHKNIKIAGPKCTITDRFPALRPGSSAQFWVRIRPGSGGSSLRSACSRPRFGPGLAELRFASACSPGPPLVKWDIIGLHLGLGGPLKACRPHSKVGGPPLRLKIGEGGEVELFWHLSQVASLGTENKHGSTQVFETSYSFW